MRFLDKLHARQSTVGIVGLGYVGIPLTLQFSGAGLKVLGFDVDPERINHLNAGRSPIGHISAARIREACNSGFEATEDFSRIGEADAIIICVPTPLGRHREPDLSFIIGTMESIAPHLRAEQLLSLESTTYPGTTAEVLLPYVERKGLTPGKNFYLVYSPEREDPGNRRYHSGSIPKILGGTTPECRDAGAALYGLAVDKIITVSSTQVAELTKLLENIHRSVNIGLVNEMKMIADRIGIDIFEVIEAAATKPFGFEPYYPGPGIGGHCIPIDPFYLTWKAREYGLETHFIELAGEVNRNMPTWVVGKITEALNGRRKALKGCRILALGIAYKRDVEDMRESPSVAIMEALRAKGAEVEYSDPMVPVFPKMRDHHFNLRSVELTPEAIAAYDCIVLLTDHSAFDYNVIANNAQLLVDTRGRYREARPNVVRA